jgi:hypothetical protein
MQLAVVCAAQAAVGLLGTTDAAEQIECTTQTLRLLWHSIKSLYFLSSSMLQSMEPNK